MSSITSWVRLEPRTRNAEMNTSLQARIYDPLWMLARQWQFGEFQGEDNGSPVKARWRAESGQVNRYYSGAIPPSTTQVEWQVYDGKNIPLETLIEREEVYLETNNPATLYKLRLAADAGQQFLRMLKGLSLLQDYRRNFTREYPFAKLTTDQRTNLDDESLRYFDLMYWRVPDGRMLYAGFRKDGADNIAIASTLQIATEDLTAVENIARLWAQWYEMLFSRPESVKSAWEPNRLEYNFSVATKLSQFDSVLTASEYYEGRLDWYSFDINAPLLLGSLGQNPPVEYKEVVQTTIPAPVSFKGMASPRFWEFEDAHVDFGSMDTGPTDLARMLLVEFALSYGNDWFVIPIELGVGSVCRTRSLIVTDTFGVNTIIKSQEELGERYSKWRMFHHSFIGVSGNSSVAPNLFFLSPSLIDNLESRPIEETMFLRDEAANMAWAVERVVESPTDRPINRYEIYLQQQQRRVIESVPQAPLPPKTLSYRLTTEVPDYWIPLMPVRIEQELRLKRGSVLKTDGSKKTVQPQGRVLNSDQEISLFEEEVPREGLRVTRSYQLARWIDGSSHLWVGRRKNVGRGEGSSGLLFDSISDDFTK